MRATGTIDRPIEEWNHLNELMKRAIELLREAKQPLNTGWLDYDSEWNQKRDQWLKDAGVDE